MIITEIKFDIPHFQLLQLKHIYISSYHFFTTFSYDFFGCVHQRFLASTVTILLRSKHEILKFTKEQHNKKEFAEIHSSAVIHTRSVRTFTAINRDDDYDGNGHEHFFSQAFAMTRN